MKIKMVGFKVGQSRPTCNITIDLSVPLVSVAEQSRIGAKLLGVLQKSDFVSIRRID